MSIQLAPNQNSNPLLHLTSAQRSKGGFSPESGFIPGPPYRYLPQPSTFRSFTLVLPGSFPVLTRRIHKTKRISATSQRTSRDEILVSASNEKRQLIRTRSLSRDGKWFHTPQLPIQRCQSPERLYPCTGYCPPRDHDRANVVNLKFLDTHFPPPVGSGF